MKKPSFKFMAMSKLIGLVTLTFVFVVMIYAMIVMYVSGVYDALPQLIISVCSVAGLYIAFYLTMAKVEHAEEERTKREKELALLKSQGASQEDINDKKDEIRELRQKASDLISESIQSVL